MTLIEMFAFGEIIFFVSYAMDAREFFIRS